MVTIDTNIAIYAMSGEEKAGRAKEALASAAFLSVQVCNEFAFTSRRKFRREWTDIVAHLKLLRQAVPNIRPIDSDASERATQIAERYQLAFFDALMIAVALANGATTLYSEDMQHGLLIDDTLRIVDPFR